MKKVIKKKINNTAQRKNCRKKRILRNKLKETRLLLKENLKKTKEDKVIINYSESLKNLKTLIRDIFNLREAKRQIKFLGVDVSTISEHIGKNFIEKCIDKLNEICNIIENDKIDYKSKKDKYFHLSKEYYRIIPHIFPYTNYDCFIINEKEKIKRELRILELLQSYRELRNKDYEIKESIAKEENNSEKLNESLNNSVNSIEKSYEDDNHTTINFTYYEKALLGTNYIFQIVEKNSDEFLRIKHFLYRYSDKNRCIYPKLSLLQLYRLNNKYHSFKKYDNLFWLGCEMPHFYSILSHGLRFPLKIKSKKIYDYGYGITISHNPYSQLENTITRNNIAYLFVCGNNGLKGRKANSFHPDYPEKMNKSKYDSIFIEHKIKLQEIKSDNIDEKNTKKQVIKTDNKDEKNTKNYDYYYDYVIYDRAKINLLYIAKIQIP